MAKTHTHKIARTLTQLSGTQGGGGGGGGAVGGGGKD